MNLVFVSHDNSRTGAPILLLNLITLIKSTNNVSIVVANYMDDGLQNEILDLGIDFIRFEHTGKTRNLFRKTAIVINNIRARIILRNRIGKADRIILNTITLYDFVVKYNLDQNNNLYSYIHELGISTLLNTSLSKAVAQISLSTKILYPCKVVEDYIKDNLNLKQQKFARLNYYFDKGIHDVTEKSTSDTFVVAGCGRPDWRKGIEIFILVAQKVLTSHPEIDIEFRWKGFSSEKEEAMFLHDIQNLKIADKVKIYSKDNDVNRFYAEANLFLLTSRSDTYPLVVIEAALQSVPSVYFEEAGGIGEFVTTDCGDHAPYLDIEAFSQKIFYYYNHRELALLKGKNARQRALELHCDSVLSMRQFKEALDF